MTLISIFSSGLFIIPALFILAAMYFYFEKKKKDNVNYSYAVIILSLAALVTIVWIFLKK